MVQPPALRDGLRVTAELLFSHNHNKRRERARKGARQRKRREMSATQWYLDTILTIFCHAIISWDRGMHLYR